MMRISRTIGVCLLILSVAVVAVALREKIQMGKAYRSAVEDVLLTLHGGDVGNSSVLTVSYRFAHGVEVVNGEQIRATDAGRADVKIVQGDMTAFLIFKEGATGRAPCKRDEAAAVRIVRPFLGDMSFKASVCGCEMMAPLIALILASALAVVMTGMGGDGMRGATDVRKGGGYCISQTEDSCVVYGMPKAVNEAGISNEAVPLDQMARRVMEIVRGEIGESP